MCVIHMYVHFQASEAVVVPEKCMTCGKKSCFYCITCGKDLCATCEFQHLRSVCSGHRTVPYAQEFDPDIVAKLFCRIHKENTADKYWCETCSVQICLTCITENHKGHCIGTMSKKLSEQSDAMLKEVKTFRSSTIMVWEDVLRRTKQLRAKYLDRVDRNDKELADLAETIHKEVNTILFNKRQTIKDIKSQNILKLEEQEQYLQQGLLLLKDEIRQYEEQVISPEPNAILQFKPGTLLQNGETPSTAIDETSLLKGSIDKTDFIEDVQKMLEHIPKPNETGDRTPKSLLPQPSSVATFKVASMSFSIACINQGRAWVRTDGKILQLLDIRDFVSTDYVIHDMVITPAGEIIHANQKDKCIKSISLDGKSRPLFNTLWEPCGLCCFDNCDIVVAFAEVKKVVRYSNTGDIRLNYDFSFKYPVRVASSNVSQDIYVVDRKNRSNETGGIIALGNDGKFKFEYSGNEEKFVPKDVCADTENHILIAVDCVNLDHNEVHIITNFGRFLQCIQIPGLAPSLHCIEVDREGNFWVGLGGGVGRDCIQVFKYLQ